MSELKKFAGYQAVQSVPREQLPVGGYVARIEAVKMEQTRSSLQRMIFRVEICEGEHKDFYHKDYEARKGGMYEAKYRGVYSINYPVGDGSEQDGWSINRFNRTMGAIEASNPGYTWDWRLESLKGKLVGIIVRESEYNGNPFTEIGMFINAENIRTGKYQLMKKRMPLGDAAEPATTPTAPPGFVQVDDDDIPF